jgi:hypothetical protein
LEISDEWGQSGGFNGIWMGRLAGRRDVEENEIRWKRGSPLVRIKSVVRKGCVTIGG